MKRYPTYKDSGVSWIGDIPEHWVCKKLKLVSYMKGRIGWQNLRSSEFTTEGPYLITGMNFKGGQINWDEVYHITEERYNEAPEIQLKISDVLMTKDGTIGKLLFIDYLPDKTSLNSHLLVFRPLRNEYFPKYLYYQFDAEPFKHHVELTKTGTTFYGITQEAVGNYKTILPPLDEQIFISSYLDRKTAQIDALISNKEKLIELLKEERTAIINQAVIKGLNPNVPMKDSGIEWLGEIPEHWEVKRLKYCFTLVGGYAFKSDDFREEGVQLIKIGNLYQNQLQLDRQPTFLPDSFKDIYSDYLAKRGDILLSLTGTLGKRDYGYAILIDQDGSFLVNQRVAIIKAKRGIDINFSINLFHSETYLNKLLSIPTGTKQGNLSGDDVLSIHMGIPPQEEQIEIMNFIQKEQNRIDLIISKTQQEIELLKEYKTALISEVVTGKIDVREEILELA